MQKTVMMTLDGGGVILAWRARREGGMVDMRYSQKRAK